MILLVTPDGKPCTVRTRAGIKMLANKLEIPVSSLKEVSEKEFRDAVITNEQLTQTAQSEMIQELNWADLQLKYHATGDTKRAISTVELINAYAVECRDYVQNVDGVLTIVGDKPSRPE